LEQPPPDRGGYPLKSKGEIFFWLICVFTQCISCFEIHFTTKRRTKGVSAFPHPRLCRFVTLVVIILHDFFHRLLLLKIALVHWDFYSLGVSRAFCKAKKDQGSVVLRNPIML